MKTSWEFPGCIGDLVDGPLEYCGRGRLGTTILRGRNSRGRGYYLKAASLASVEDLSRERQILGWLRDRLPVPEVMGYAEDSGWAFLALSEGEGERSETSGQPVAETVALLGRTLSNIHILSKAHCPVGETLDEELARAGCLLAKGWIDYESFQADNDGRTPDEVYRELLNNRDFPEDLVFTHGDFAMPNVLVRGGQVTSILDWANARAGDRHRDFVVMRDSLQRNCGPDWIPAFLKAYGGGNAIDPARMEFYALLDQMFSHFAPAAISPEWIGVR